MKNVVFADFDSALFANNIHTAEHIKVGTVCIFQDIPEF